MPTCKICQHYGVVIAAVVTGAANERPGGVCRRYPPQATALLMPASDRGVGVMVQSFYPPINENDKSCGEFERPPATREDLRRG